MKTLADVLRGILREKGVEEVGALSKRFRKSQNPIQDIAIEIVYGKGAIVRLKERTHGAWDLNGNRVEGSFYAYVPSCMVERFEPIVRRDDLLKLLPDWPRFIIDLMHWDNHTQTEKGKICLQAVQCYGLLRDYFTGRELAVTWANDEFRRMYNGPLDRITVYDGPTAEFLEKEGIDEVVLLDPWAEEVLSEDDFNAKAFIIGGIVDTSGSKKKTTPKIGEELEKAGIRARRRKIVLKGKTIGVPDRINRILGIILKMMVEGKSMNEAVYEMQEPLHARWRLRKELPKHVIKYRINGKTYRVVEKELFDEYSKWLKIRWEDFIKALKDTDIIALERKRIHHLNKISAPRVIHGKTYRVILLKKAAMLCYNC
ncbi:tRNA (guanine(9)-/adenine(9)-N1)-methyltransferase [Thermococcus sp. Bubb.Bath]|uniref:tRNA (guanine(9)-/adenine(9)-N1)-methyltransferase n=1 Tax=Thermococcus sp. Bubb.Bath TaxID=1638242 RepID=UPI001439BF54|nr:tRNA (guanine(9)-/adenine(9)-N1)-methyltransferase [Thermococcus sp. Bubb.Bath]NJF24523.1 tRNA (guanine-N2)-dimethyltransferase [Thermococcus sp. Bubb.Bath]